MAQHTIAGLLMMVIGAVLTMKPDQTWKLMDAWKNSSGGTISVLYRTALRVVGAVMIAVGVGVLLFGH